MKKRGFAIIGAGNLGSRLALELKQAGHHPEIVISRSPEKAANLASLLSCPFSLKPDIPKTCELVFICTPDDAIPVLVENLKHIPIPVFHCSGSTSINVFKGRFMNYGVFYPLQTFTAKAEINMKQTPLLIEGSSPEITGLLEEIANEISEKVIRAGSEERLKCHLAAVFAANFSNHMIHTAENILLKSGLDPAILHPLLDEMIRKVKLYGARESQTGPARRMDHITMDRHVMLLAGEPSLQNLYTFVSDGIMQAYKKEL